MTSRLRQVTGETSVTHNDNTNTHIARIKVGNITKFKCVTVIFNSFESLMVL